MLRFFGECCGAVQNTLKGLFARDLIFWLLTPHSLWKTRFYSAS